MRSPLFPLLGLLAACVAACSGASTDSTLPDSSGDADNPGGKADSPVDVGSIDIDHGNGAIALPEVSGLALRTFEGRLQMLAIGDSELAVAIADVPSSVKPSELSFSLHDLGALFSTAPPSQWEAVAADPAGRLFLLEENPGAVYVVSPDLDSLLHTFDLRVESDGPDWKRELAEDWGAESNSRGEGMALCAQGHLLVLKEKQQPCLVEFAPEGASPAGLSAPLSEPFSLPASAHSSLVPVRVWEFASSVRDVLPDMSDLFVDGTGRLYIVSGDGRAIGRVRESIDPSDDGKLHLDAAWKLPKEIANPEGLVLLDDEEPWVASDTKDDVNLFELDRIAP